MASVRQTYSAVQSNHGLPPKSSHAPANLFCPAVFKGLRGVQSAPRSKTARCLMPKRHTLIRVSVTLPAADYRVYESAARILTRIMGAQAPTAPTIIRAQLSRSDPSGIADDHLDSMGWPLEGAKRIGRACWHDRGSRRPSGIVRRTFPPEDAAPAALKSRHFVDP